MTASETEHYKYYPHGDAVHFVLKADRADTWSSESSIGMFTKADLREMLSVFEPEVVPLKVGDVIYGYCHGEFGRDSYDDKTVELIGRDYVVYRYEGGSVGVWQGTPNDLAKYTAEPDEYGGYPLE